MSDELKSKSSLTTSATKSIEIYTDGACIGNPGPGGWAFLIKDQGQKLFEGAGGESHTTNNRMELMAAIKGLSGLKGNHRAVQLYSDSRYLVDAFVKGWLQSWEQRGWKTADKSEVKNQDLWQELQRLDELINVEWVWVKGHANQPDNEYVDRLARMQAEKFGATIDKA